MKTSLMLPFVPALLLLGCNGKVEPAGPAGPATTAPTATAAAPAPAPAPAANPAPAGNGTDTGSGNGGDSAGTGSGGGKDDHSHMAQADLGELDIEGFKLQVKQFGSIEMGDALAADVSGEIPNGAGLYAWIADAKGNPLGAAADSDKTDGKWHFHLMQDNDEAEPVWLYLRIRGGGKDARGRLLLHGAEEPPPHGGSTGGFTPSGDEEAVDPVGTVEAVWDPKTGSISVWIYSGTGFGTPMALDKDKGVIALLDDAPIELEIKDAAKGHAVITGSDDLKDADLTPMVTFMFTSGGKEYTSELLVLENE